jgi:hypothetical protein
MQPIESNKQRLSVNKKASPPTKKRIRCGTHRRLHFPAKTGPFRPQRILRLNKTDYRPKNKIKIQPFISSRNAKIKAKMKQARRIKRVINQALKKKHLQYKKEVHSALKHCKDKQTNCKQKTSQAKNRIFGRK